ncbi:2Fe-2S iron-sulfur cluster binding domain-containing protein [Saccharopolyspora rhizosphaerae]|uniref:2Fe-2S iron-sulfur cluster binding domain-containing protein n=1 Tax=Saccharopolyspora rhizosphaerae TaxID=2492662 RepID=A0A426JM00_9PSEU|nr:2Fe-2S iron-sulfur cluster-binding protein [Saccharopolyspora rhizosphaerae]RRO14253.1 2Fe-2S iron-sulfur cluster binding domain-containing protein [Saccharopolyspora rhizosphaerae]
MSAPEVAHDVRIDPLDRSTTCAAGQSILESCLRNDIWLPHSCTQGTCGSCKVKVLSGEVDHRGSSEYTLTPEERSAGIALGCQATPRSGLVLEPVEKVDPDDGVPRHPLRDHTGTVVVLDDIARDVRRLVVELDEPMAFNPGQYAEITVPGTGVARQYSMANPPSETSRLEFHVRRTPGGIATDGWMFAGLSVGERVELAGPLGDFGMPLAQAEPAILIAGGTGLAPLKSIARHALAHDLVPELHLYHGGRSRQDLYDVELFEDLVRAHPNFRYRPCLCEEDWDGSTGLVTDVVLADFQSCRGLSAYLCGPPGMVEAGVKALKRRRMAPRKIHREEFLDASHTQR